MSEIIKLYENAEVEKPQINYCKSDNCPFNWKYGICQTKKCPNWTTKQSKCYPPFTAEKQIELIKWLGHRRHLDIDIHSIKGCTIYDISNDYDCIVGEHKFMFDSNTFEDALAGLINQVYHSLTEEEKQQIKEILNEKL